MRGPAAELKSRWADQRCGMPAEHPKGRNAMTGDLSSSIANATSVRITQVGAFNPRHRRSSEPIAVVSDIPSLDRLHSCLGVDVESLNQQWQLMTPGDVDLNVLVGHELVATVTFIYPDFLRWRGWGADARLCNGAELAAWLVERGCPLPQRSSP